MAKTAKELKEMTLKEFNKAAGEFCVRGGKTDYSRYDGKFHHPLSD